MFPGCFGWCVSYIFCRFWGLLYIYHQNIWVIWVLLVAVEVTIWVSTALSANSSTSRWRDARFRPWPWKRGALVGEMSCLNIIQSLGVMTWGVPKSWLDGLQWNTRKELDDLEVHTPILGHLHTTADNIQQPLMWCFNKLLKCWDMSIYFLHFHVFFYQQVAGPPTIYVCHGVPINQTSYIIIQSSCSMLEFYTFVWFCWKLIFSWKIPKVFAVTYCKIHVFFPKQLHHFGTFQIRQWGVVPWICPWFCTRRWISTWSMWCFRPASLWRGPWKRTSLVWSLESTPGRLVVYVVSEWLNLGETV